MKRNLGLQLVALLLTLTACGTTVLARKIEPAAAPSVEPTNLRQIQLTKGSQGAVNIGHGVTVAAKDRCATTSDPKHGYTATTMKWGTIIPLSGAIRTLGEQTARIMLVAVAYPTYIRYFYSALALS